MFAYFQLFGMRVQSNMRYEWWMWVAVRFSHCTFHATQMIRMTQMIRHSIASNIKIEWIDARQIYVIDSLFPIHEETVRINLIEIHHFIFDSGIRTLNQFSLKRSNIHLWLDWCYFIVYCLLHQCIKENIPNQWNIIMNFLVCLLNIFMIRSSFDFIVIQHYKLYRYCFHRFLFVHLFIFSLLGLSHALS